MYQVTRSLIITIVLLMYLLCYIIYEVGNVNIDVQKVDQGSMGKGTTVPDLIVFSRCEVIP